MRSVYSMIIDKVIKDGGRHKIVYDLENKTVTFNGTELVSQATPIAEWLKGVPLMTEEERQLNMDELFEHYYCSRIDNVNARTTHFVCKGVDELTTNEMVNGMNRSEAKARLELFIMFADLSHLFKDGNYYWQSKVNPNFVIFKKHIGHTKGE